ncbi:NAD(P)-binding protein [Serendipita vermifera]|nr:NAD(P)-binding protein [Serendipita vermifera]
MKLPFISNGHAMDRYRHGEKPFALVTGSSQGIGKALALELARLGFNLIIHSKTMEEVIPAEKEILKLYPNVTVVSLAQDAGVPVDWPKFMEQLSGLNITVLINNVGASAPVPFQPLDKVSPDAIGCSVHINTIFPTQLTAKLLPTLIENSPSLILNICSGSTYVPCGFITVYCGSKAFNLIWSKALYNELKLLRRDVKCKAVMTGSVSTEGHSIPEGTFVPSAAEYARSTLARANSSGPEYVGWARHRIQLIGVGLIATVSSSAINFLGATIAKDLVAWRNSIKDPQAMKFEDLPR